jgi:hypothetical protein
MEVTIMSRLFTALLLALTCISCQTEARHMNAPRIDKLFEKTKPVCFGRFVIHVPVSAEIVPGPQAFGGEIQSIAGGSKNLRQVATQKASELNAVKHGDGGALLRLVDEGPTQGSRVLQFRETKWATRVTQIWAYLNASPVAYVYKTATAPSEGRTVEKEMAEVSYIATHLRARAPAEVPKEPGVCLDVGFIADDTGKFQEIFGVGLRFPELPDASFSISTNKDAQQGDSFEDRRAEAKRAALMVPEQAGALGKIKTLREGKLKVSQGEGSEALFRRPITKADGHWHEFQFEYAGKRLDHHNPSWDAALFTGVERDQAGSVASSLSDDEAIALWDRLMASVRLRVVR